MRPCLVRWGGLGRCQFVQLKRSSYDLQPPPCRVVDCLGDREFSHSLPQVSKVEDPSRQQLKNDPFVELSTLLCKV
jgi:hypothetical protein